MEALRVEADESSAKVDELKSKVKTLEQENLQKEQEITSLQHKLSVAEGEVEKLETAHGDAKRAVDESAQAGTQNESLQRKVQLLEEEAEENDKTLRETNEKYDAPRIMPFSPGSASRRGSQANIIYRIDSAKLTSRPAITNAKSKPSRRSATSGSRSTRRWPRNTPTRKRSSTTLWRRLVTSKPIFCTTVDTAYLALLLHGFPVADAVVLTSDADGDIFLRHSERERHEARCLQGGGEVDGGVW